MSAAELFDVVDEHDNVIDVRQRSEVHRLGLRHRAAHIFLFRPDGRLLIHRRTDTKEEFPSVWTSSASGHVSSGETYAVSAVRELEEELGVRAQLSFVLKVNACPDTCNEFTELYTAVSEDDISPDPEEIADVAWVTPEQLQQRLQHPDDFSPAFLLLYERYNQLAQ